jgi:hypothetical protein
MKPGAMSMVEAGTGGEMDESSIYSPATRFHKAAANIETKIFALPCDTFIGFSLALLDDGKTFYDSRVTENLKRHQAAVKDSVLLKV